jgi:hypothetical protein
METTLKSVKDLIAEFSNATTEKDFISIEKILDEKGIFEIQDNNLEMIDVGKNEFLTWYKNTLSTVEILEHHYDQCVGCSFGKQVVLFNDGSFPRVQKDLSDRSKTGFMIDSENGKITKIAFCFVFLKTENKYIFECVGKIINDEVKKGVNFDQAVENFRKNPDYNHFKFDDDEVN